MISNSPPPMWSRAKSTKGAKGSTTLDPPAPWQIPAARGMCAWRKLPDLAGQDGAVGADASGFVVASTAVVAATAVAADLQQPLEALAAVQVWHLRFAISAVWMSARG